MFFHFLSTSLFQNSILKVFGSYIFPIFLLAKNYNIKPSNETKQDKVKEKNLLPNNFFEYNWY